MPLFLVMMSLCSVGIQHIIYYLLDSQAIFSNIFGHGGHQPSLEILTNFCATFCLMLIDRPMLALPEYKVKVVNICEMHQIGGPEVVVVCTI